MNLFNIAYVKYWFLYKSFNTKSLFKRRREPGHCILEAKVYEFHFFLYNFAQGHLRFHVLMFLQKLKAVPESLKGGFPRVL